MSYDDDLGGDDYDIVNELKIRKKLEAGSDWRYEFTKQTKYGYDLELYRWSESADAPDDRRLFGYIELERASIEKSSCPWVTGTLPDGWVYLSFLKRKVHQWDWDIGRFVDDLKPNARRAMYLKFNHSMDNCFIAPITTIARDGSLTKKSDGTRTNTYLSLDPSHPEVRIGVDESISFIEEYLDSFDAGQSGLEAYTDGGDSDD
ncbi:hypothetical protein OSG_eHP31_00135 [environmental Halophage eHP-31]|nr:hypothetical protein OSG_eHP31_00135 [environmental Halophage eHP-31]